MKKDPAFLFYPEKWLQGTASMMPEEKGIYIDLLAHQHQDRDLPNDTKRLARMCGMAEAEFLKLWDVVGKKFEVANGNRLVNRKLTEVITERSTKSLTNQITGQFASIIRLSNLSAEIKENLKKDFVVADFVPKSDRTLKERLTDWVKLRSESIINIDSNYSTKESLSNGSTNKKNRQQFRNFKSQGEETVAAGLQGRSQILGNGTKNN